MCEYAVTCILVFSVPLFIYLFCYFVIYLFVYFHVHIFNEKPFSFRVWVCNQLLWTGVHKSNARAVSWYSSSASITVRTEIKQFKMHVIWGNMNSGTAVHLHKYVIYYYEGSCDFAAFERAAVPI